MGDTANAFSPDRTGDDDDNEGKFTGINKYKITDVQLNHTSKLFYPLLYPAPYVGLEELRGLAE